MEDVLKEAFHNPEVDKNALTAAVVRFSAFHDLQEFTPGQKIYRELIPKTKPGPGEQYAFEVDLDKCTGCKACVTACHNENGLDEDETWRSVGFLQGGTSENPVAQHVTTACHHCAEPACMTGCPTKAYVKDAATGIVKHLEDQCFGCQYCILKCPYDVPKYNPKRGIVHKCDMCIGRLNAGEAPACARACPTGAIRITLVKTEDVKKNFEEFVRVPDAPASNYTYPTTRYTTSRTWPQNTVSVDYLTAKPEHSHLPLVVMLILTQASVGTFLAQMILKKILPAELNQLLFPVHIWIALATGLLALAASIFHLGRPHLAFRAILGLKTSWLSREILAFGLFANLAVTYAVCGHWENAARTVGKFLGGPAVLDVLGSAVFLSGLIGVLCSVMVYRDTQRPFWDNHWTTLKFLMTTALLGSALSLSISFVYTAHQAPYLIFSVKEIVGRMFCLAILGFSVAKMILESGIFYYLRKDDRNFLKKTAVLMTRPLKNVTAWRFVLGVLGGIALPSLILALNSKVVNSPLLASLAFLSFLLLLAGEFLERYLFFRAVVPLKMPGGKVN